ncbi:MAG: sulfotransferase domain-containing protein [Micromonosporaceae bacterium]|nr:sulfotransferase domain-containing protein [Micromonosporaceae bacterium]
MARPAVRYQTSIMDSGRWDEITLREGDIVISTPPKCGTTWTEMICALLILQTAELSQSLDDMAPWVDMLIPSRAELRAVYESKSHRRFFKSHTPLDGLPVDDRVAYICVGRDPRDAAFSWLNHMANLNIDVVSELVEAAAAAERRPATSAREHLRGIPPDSPPYEQFLAWVDNQEPLGGLPWLVTHLASFWEARTWPNVMLLHYDDLRADLSGQMRSLAEWLRIDVPADCWDELVTAAEFTSMSHRADKLVPGPVWREPSRFFHKGTSGQWREVLDVEAERRYWRRVRELADPELVAWLHRPPATDVVVPA